LTLGQQVQVGGLPAQQLRELAQVLEQLAQQLELRQQVLALQRHQQ
jgi:hypothetical protein